MILPNLAGKTVDVSVGGDVHTVEVVSDVHVKSRYYRGTQDRIIWARHDGKDVQIFEGQIVAVKEPGDV